MFDDDFSLDPVGISFEGAVRVDCSRVGVVGENAMWTDEYAVFNGCAVVNGGVVLNFAVISDDDAFVYVDIFTNDAICTNYCLFTNLGLVPDGSVLSNIGLG